MFQGMDWKKARQRLNLFWYTSLPTAMVIGAAVFYVAINGGHLKMPETELPRQFIELLPVILGFAALLGAGFSRVLSRHAVKLAKRGTPTAAPAELTNSAMFIVLGAANAPAIIAMALYAMTHAEWIPFAIVAYSFIAAFVLKPDLDRLYEQAVQAQPSRSS